MPSTLRPAVDLRRRLAESGHGVRVTFSAGIAELHPQRSALDDILRAADRALYAAKDGGRNRSELATPP
jgi:diguanylate cyclase (GGDEF)-like protein